MEAGQGLACPLPGPVILLLLSLTVFMDGANAGRHFYLPGLTTLVMACFEEFI